MKFLNFMKFILQVISAAGFLIFEELVWKIFALPVKEAFAKLDIANKLKAKIETKSTYQTLGIFLFPLVIAEIMGIYSGMLFVSGSIFAAVFWYILKIPVAGITFWIFSFTKEKLLLIDWFKTLYDLLIRFLNFVKGTEIYKSTKEKMIEIKKSIKRLMPGSGTFKEEITSIYNNLKKMSKDVSSKVNEMKKEAKEINEDTTEKK